MQTRSRSARNAPPLPPPMKRNRSKTTRKSPKRSKPAAAHTTSHTRSRSHSRSHSVHKNENSNGKPFANPSKDPTLVNIVQRFHGQLHLVTGVKMADPKHSQPPQKRIWRSSVLTQENHLKIFQKSVNDRNYSMSAGKGGLPLSIPIQQAKVDWRHQAMFVHVSVCPNTTHSISIQRTVPGKYMAKVLFVEKKQRATIHGLGSFDACIFDLVQGQKFVDMSIEGVEESLPNGPQWESQRKK